MSLPKIAIIRNADAQKVTLPRYGNPVGTSMTLLSANVDSVKIAPGHYEIIDTGLAIALPIGLEAQVRSLKQSTQTGVFVLNAPVTIDASDRQVIKVCLYNASMQSVIIKYNDPIALLVFNPALRIEWDDMTLKHQIKAAQMEVSLKEYQTKDEASFSKDQVVDEFEPVAEEIQSEATEQTFVKQAPPLQEEIVQESEDDSLAASNEEKRDIIEKFEALENNYYDEAESATEDK